MSEQGWVIVIAAVIAFGCFLIFANSPAGLRWAQSRLCERSAAAENDPAVGPLELAWLRKQCEK